MQKKWWQKKSKLIAFFTVIIIMLLVLSSAYASQSNEADELIRGINQQLEENQEMPTGSNDNSLFASFVKMLVAFIAVLLAAFFTVRFMGSINRVKSKQGWLQVLEYDSIGPNKGITIVKIGDRGLILGVTDNSITQLCTLTAEELTELELASATDEDASSTKWQGLLSKIFPGILGKNSSVDSSANQQSFHNHLQQNLHRVQSMNQQLKNNIKGDGGNE